MWDDTKNIPLATDLVARISIANLEFMEEVRRGESSLQEYLEYAGANDFFDLTQYPYYLHSNGSPPCFFRHLEGTLNTIAHIARIRTPLSDEEDFPDWFMPTLFDFKYPIDLRNDLPELEYDGDATSMLRTALRYWVRAALAYDRSEILLSVSSIMQSCLYLGMAMGPKFASEQNRIAGEKRTEHLAATAHEAKRLLENLAKELQGKKLSHQHMLATLIAGDLERFHDEHYKALKIEKSKSGSFVKIKDMHAYLIDIFRPDHDYYKIIESALTSVCELRQGKPKNEAIDYFKSIKKRMGII